jgi:hypothetical protein
MHPLKPSRRDTHNGFSISRMRSTPGSCIAHLGFIEAIKSINHTNLMSHRLLFVYQSRKPPEGPHPRGERPEFFFRIESFDNLM